MWESIATTRRQDRVLHGMAKGINVVVGLVALPAWLIGQLAAGPVRRLLARFESGSHGPLPVPPRREPTMDALMADLRLFPQDLRRRPGAELRRGLADISSFVVSQRREGAVLGYSYPAQFSDHVFSGADGERIAATIGLHDEPRPGLIVVHGLFTSSRFDYVRQIAVRAYYSWGFNVAAIDLRSFGMTELTTSAPSTAGWKEGLDLIELGRYMKELGSTSVGALGISLGANSVLGASHPEGAEEALDGGLLAVSPPADPRAAAERLSRKVPRRHPAYALNYGFHAMLVARQRAGRWPIEITSLPLALEVLAPPYYGIDADQLWKNASARDHIAGARVPILILHPEDDHIVTVEHAHMLAEAAAGNDLVRVWVLPAGSHGVLEAVDPRWTYSVYRAFFERWARYTEREDGQVSGNGKLVYSVAK